MSIVTDSIHGAPSCRQTLQLLDDIFRLHAFDHRHERAPAAMPVLVRQHCVKAPRCLTTSRLWPDACRHCPGKVRSPLHASSDPSRGNRSGDSIVVVQNVSLEVREIGNAPDAYSMRVKVVILKSAELCCYAGPVCHQIPVTAV